MYSQHQSDKMIQTTRREGSERSEGYRHLPEKGTHLSDGVSTQVGGDTWQGKPTGTSQGKQPESDARIEAGRMAEMPCPGARCGLYFEDLHSFKLSVERPLFAAWQSLEGIDDDLCQALAKVCTQVAELTQCAAFVVQSHGQVVHRILNDVFPNFKLPSRVGEPSSMAVVQRAITRMKNDAKVVRTSYLSTMEAIQYLAACTQVVMDFYDCSLAPDGAHAPHMLNRSPQTSMRAARELDRCQNMPVRGVRLQVQILRRASWRSAA